MKDRCLARFAISAIAFASSSLLPARATGIKPGDPGVYQLGSSLYKLVFGPSWAQAEANAVQLGGHLAAIGSEEENSFLFSVFNLTGDWYNLNYHPLWAGLSDAAQEGSWVWSNGDQLVYTNWAPTLPQYGQGCAAPDGGTPCQPTDEDYLQLGRFPAGYWNDAADSISRTSQGIAEIHFSVSSSAPSPLPILGTAVAFRCSRKLRKRIHLTATSNSAVTLP
jgi:hypothetical protein